jgi:uncharacterized protein YbjT (DUF2867 family)
MPDPILLTGASGYVGSHVLAQLRRRELPGRARARDPSKLPADGDGRRGDGGAGTGRAVIHSRWGGGGDFAARDRQAAVNFGEAAKDAGVRRVIYLGGRGDAASSAHLRSRDEVARLLRERVPELVYARAAMIIGPGSASFEMLRHLVARLDRKSVV